MLKVLICKSSSCEQADASSYKWQLQHRALYIGHICNGSGANVLLLFSLVKEKISCFLLAP